MGFDSKFASLDPSSKSAYCLTSSVVESWDKKSDRGNNSLTSYGEREGSVESLNDDEPLSSTCLNEDACHGDTAAEFDDFESERTTNDKSDAIDDEEEQAQWRCKPQ